MRCEIYNHFLRCPLAVPCRTQEERDQRNDHITAYPRYRAELCAKYSLSPPQFSVIPLLLCNRLIHEEFTATTTTFLHLNRLRYELDCEINGDQYLYPDWLLLPVKASHIPCLYVSFRFYGAGAVDSGWWPALGWGPLPMICGLSYILFRFLQRGPHLLSEVTDRNITIGALVLDVVTPFPETHQVFKPIGSTELEEGTPDAFIYPETLVSILHRHVDSMYLRGVERNREHVSTILQNVEKVYLLHDGNEKSFWDLQAPPVVASAGGA